MPPINRSEGATPGSGLAASGTGALHVGWFRPALGSSVGRHQPETYLSHRSQACLGRSMPRRSTATYRQNPADGREVVIGNCFPRLLAGREPCVSFKRPPCRGRLAARSDQRSLHTARIAFPTERLKKPIQENLPKIGAAPKAHVANLSFLRS